MVRLRPQPSIVALFTCAVVAVFSPVSSIHAQTGTGGFTPFLNASDHRAVAYDGDRFLWIASNGGALRFDPADGSWDLSPRQRVGGPVGNDLTTATVAADGVVWVGTADRGVSFFDPAIDRWERFEEVPDNRITVIHNTGEAVFVGTQNGLSLRFTANRIDVCNDVATGCTVPSFLIHDFVSQNDTLWVATEAGLGRFNGVGWDSLHVLPAGSVGGSWSSLAAHDGDLFGVRQGVVVRLTGSEWASTERAAATLVASGGRLFARTTSGIWEWTGDAWEELPVPGVGQIRDFELIGAVFYIATDNGLVIWNPLSAAPLNFVRHIPPGPQVAGFHRGIAVNDDGTVWAGNQQGLLRYDGSEWTFFEKGVDGLDGEWIFSLAASAGEVAVGHCCCDAPGRCRLDIEGAGAFETTEAFDVWSLDIDAAGRIWAGTNDDGAYVLEKRSGAWEIVLQLTNANTGGGLRSNSIRAIAVTPEGTYFGHSQNFGVDFWSHGGSLPSAVPISPNPWKPFTTQSGLLDGNVASLRASGRDVFVGTSTGLHRISIGAVIDDHRTNFSEIAGDLPRIVQAIVVDRAGGVWAGTNNGILYLARGADVFRLFDTVNSDLTSNDVLSGDLNPVDGSIWFGTTLGVTRIDPSQALGLVSSEESFTLYPNPFLLDLQKGVVRVTLGRSIGGGEPTAADDSITGASVFDLAGRDIGSFTLESQEWQWNLRNENGDIVVPGLYLVRARTAGGDLVELKLGVIR